MFLLLILNIFHNFPGVSIVNFEQVNVSWQESLAVVRLEERHNVLLSIYHRIIQHHLYVISLTLISHQLTFTCSKSLIETLEKGVKYVQS